MTDGLDVPRRFIGWTGHRTIPNELAVRNTVTHVLSALTRCSFDWTGIGSAAIGADLIVADAIIQQGMPVRIVLPCSLDEMLAITPAQHKSKVQRICAASEVAPSVFLGTDSHPDYVGVAREIASKADVLVAVWDGSPARGPGGTADVVRLSQEQGIRVIRIDPTTGSCVWSGCA